MTLLPQVRRQLYTAAERQIKRRTIVGMRLPTTWRAVPRFRPGHFAVAASVLVVVAIVAVFVGVHGSSTSTTSGSGTTSIPISAVPAGTPAAARFVVARMAVLRRPQRPEDRLPAAVSAQLKNTAFGPSFIPSLTRLAATFHPGLGPASSISVYVIVGPAYRGVDIAIALTVIREPGNRYLITQPEVVDEETAIPTGGLTPTAVAIDDQYVLCGPTWCKSQPLPPLYAIAVGVVPDGVARAEWTFHGSRHSGAKPVMDYPRVENNVAVFKVAPGTVGPRAAIWYGANGRLIQAIPIIVRPVPQRPVPAVVGRSFATLRGVSANHPVAIANTLGMRLWLVPHTTQLCFQYVPLHPRYLAGGGGGCVSIGMALEGNFTSGLFGPKSETLIGVAPNGNRTVRLTLRDGSSEVVPVSQNVYIAKASSVFASVTLKDANGALRTWRTP